MQAASLAGRLWVGMRMERSMGWAGLIFARDVGRFVHPPDGETLSMLTSGAEPPLTTFVRPPGKEEARRFVRKGARRVGYIGLWWALLG